jgi:hypothetical protein
LEEVPERFVTIGNIDYPFALVVILGIDDAVDGNVTYTEG